MTPALIKPNRICNIPAINTAKRKLSKEPKSSIAENTITAREIVFKEPFPKDNDDLYPSIF